MAQVDYFLKLDGIEGESADDKHKNEIAVESWSWGEVNAGTHAAGGGGGAGKVQMQDFRFIMQANKATPKLMLACATGQHINQAILTCRKAGGDQQEYLIIKFDNVLVSSHQTAAGTADFFFGYSMPQHLAGEADRAVEVPSVYVPTHRADPGRKPMPSWQVLLLPYVEQDNLFRADPGRLLPYVEQDNLWSAPLPRRPLSIFYAPPDRPRGRGVFTVPTAPAAPWGAVGRHVALGDLNSDGRHDVIVPTHQPGMWPAAGGSNFLFGGGSVRMVMPADQVSLNFSKIEFEYKPQNPDGSLGSPVKAGYDVKANKKV